MALAQAGLEIYRRELLKGSTDTLILALLAGKQMYGYQLVREMEQRSGGYFHLKEGTLYPALHRLERDGLLEGAWEESGGQSRRYYRVSPAGQAKLKSMICEWDLFTKAVDLVARPVGQLTGGLLSTR